NAIPHQLHKRTTAFGDCTLLPGVPTSDLLTVTISPDPVVPGKNDTFTVNGKLTKPITSSDTLVIIFEKSLPDPPIRIGNYFIAQIPTGTTVNVTENVPVPSLLPSRYTISVGILGPPGLKGCAAAFVH
ncbi:3478_t:CDS:1, partial [Scutellospora calospora]